jgi:outer membrane biosynthesis protein TonB
MATTVPAPTGQAQPSAPAGSGNHNIDVLQSMLNLTVCRNVRVCTTTANNLQFVHTGRFLKETQAGGGTGRMKQQLQQAIPKATERFHDALDELENEVRLAQMVLRRDMALLKQDRKKREAAAKEQEVEKARLAAESRNPVARIVEEPMKMEKVATPTPPEPPKSPEAPPKAKEPEPATEAVSKPEGEDAKVPPPIETNVEPLRDPLFDGTPTTANPQESEFDFDAMFGDAMDTSGDNNQNDMMDTPGDMDFTLDEGNDGPSLLRGLEDFAKDSDDDNANNTSNMDVDFAMPDLPDLDLDTNTSKDAKPVVEPEPIPTPAPAPVPASKAEEPKPAPQPPAEEKKQEAPADEDMMATMAVDDLEDLFNMDEYENPEQSQFDDAFFNFE